MQGSRLVIISDPYYMKSTWYQDTIDGIRTNARLLRYQPEISIISDPIPQVDFSSLPQVVVVTNGSQPYVNGAIRGLVEASKQVVLSGLDSERFSEMISCATSSRRTDMERLVYYLISQGRRRIALVGFWRGSINDTIFYHAAMGAATRYCAPIPEHAAYFWNNQLTESLVPFIQNSSQFDAAICPNDTVALCLVRFCRQNKIAIPDDLYLTGISNMEIGRYCDPSLTTLGMDFHSIGCETLNVWHYIQDHLPRQTSIKVLVPGKLIIRASTDFKPELPYTFLNNIPNCAPEGNPDNQFFTDQLINALIRVENCLHQCDELDQKILVGMMQGKSYESLAEALFLSVSAIRYRRNRIFKNADVKTRVAFEELMRENISSTKQQSDD